MYGGGTGLAATGAGAVAFGGNLLGAVILGVVAVILGGVMAYRKWGTIAP